MASLEGLVALRYLRSKDKAGFLSVLAWIALSGVVVGVMALVVALSFASGFQTGLREKIIGVNAHLLLLQFQGSMTDVDNLRRKILACPDVAAAMPFTYHQGMIRSAASVTGTVVRGVPPEAVSELMGATLRFPCGSMAGLSARRRSGKADGGDLPPILLGKGQAESLEVTCGDKVDLISIPSDLSSSDVLKGSLRSYRVAGIFEVGMYEYDSSLALVPLSEAQEAFRMGETVTGFEIRLQDIRATDRAAAAFERMFPPPFWTKTWKEINPSFFSALKLQKAVMFLVLVLIILVAGFNIVSTLIMTMIEKRREVAILKAVGAAPRSVGRIFLLQGFLMGLAGTGLGLLAGYGVCLLAGRYPLVRLDPEIYYLSSLPVETRAAEFLLVGLAALALCGAASLYPAVQAARLHPAEVLRYE